MEKGTVYVFVEGDDDQRFVEAVLCVLLRQKYTSVKIWQYSEKPKTKIKDFLRTILQMEADVIFIADMDNAPCFTKKKEDLVTRYPELNPTTIFVVKPEIEGWYVSGVAADKLNQFGIDIGGGVDSFTKERLDSSLNTDMVRTEVLIELLREFSINQAKARSSSFAYLIDRRC